MSILQVSHFDIHEGLYLLRCKNEKSEQDTAKTCNRRMTRVAATYSFIVLLYSSVYWSQDANLIQNGSFEVLLPSASQTPLDAAKYWTAIDSANSISYLAANRNSPLQNVPYCSFGFQFPKSGDGFIGSSFFCSPDCTVGYPKSRLASTLDSGTVYCGRYFVVNTNNNRVAIQEYGMFFGGNSLDTVTICNNPLPYLDPQIEYNGGIITDTLNWTPISGTFVATGSEKFVVLGNFNVSASTSTVIINTPLPNKNGNDAYIDDVSLVEMELPAYAGNDTNIIAGDSVFVGREPDSGIDYACQWFQLPNDSIPIDTIAGLWVKPTTKATYVVRQQLWCSGVKWDTVVVHVNNVGLSEFSFSQENFKVYPIPASEYLIVQPALKLQYKFSVRLYDSMGKLVQTTDRFDSDGSIYIDTKALLNGIYFISLGLYHEANKRLLIQH
jgi:hypothetical protein